MGSLILNTTRGHTRHLANCHDVAACRRVVAALSLRRRRDVVVAASSLCRRRTSWCWSSFRGVLDVHQAYETQLKCGRFSCFSISIVHPTNKTLGVVIQYGKWSALQGASSEMVSSHSLKIHDFRSCLFGFSIPTVYVPNKTLGVVIQYGKWSAHQGASFGMVSSHIWKITDFRLQHFRQLAIDFPIKIRFGICSKQLLAMKNRFLTLPKPEKLHFVELLTI